jgi:hypothetical protein
MASLSARTATRSASLSAQLSNQYVIILGPKDAYVAAPPDAVNCRDDRNMRPIEQRKCLGMNPARSMYIYIYIYISNAKTTIHVCLKSGQLGWLGKISCIACGLQTDAAWNDASRPHDCVFGWRTPPIFVILPIATTNVPRSCPCAQCATTG